MARDVASLLSLLQLSDSAFPSGRYTLSHGLEAFAQDEQLRGPGALLTLLGDCIRSSAGPSDGIALACAHRALRADTPDLGLAVRADERLTAVKLVREAREASMRSGRALLATATIAFDSTALRGYPDRVADGDAPGNHAIVLGLMSAALGVPRSDAVAGELYAFAAGWASAAVRLGLVDHRGAQHLLHRVRPVSAMAALRAAGGDVKDISSSGPLPEVMSMRHEESRLRLFAT
jgi:urease accessory protein